MFGKPWFSEFESHVIFKVRIGLFHGNRNRAACKKIILIPTSLPVSDSFNFIFYGKRVQIHVLFVYTDFFLINLARL
jgi:hypothetical protein